MILPFGDEPLAADTRSVEIIGASSFDPDSDDDVTRRPRANQKRSPPHFIELRNIDPTRNPSVRQRPTYARNIPTNNVEPHDQSEECSTREILGVINRLLDNMASNQAAATQGAIVQSPSGATTTWNDHDYLKRWAGKALATNFDKKMFS